VFHSLVDLQAAINRFVAMVGQKVAAEGSDKQLEQTYMDAEALLQINDDMHKLLKQNTLLTEQINELICHAKKE
jgi:hypothetical protein